MLVTLSGMVMDEIFSKIINACSPIAVIPDPIEMVVAWSA